MSNVSSVELTLAREDDEDRHVVELRLEAHGGGPPLVVQARRKRLPDALAQAFDGAENRLRYGAAAGQPAA